MDLTTLLNSVDKNTPIYYILVLIYLVVQVAPIIAAKKKSAKIDHLAKRTEFVFNKATQIVVPLAERAGLANADRREAAVDALYKFLQDKKIKVNKKDLYAITEAAYKQVKNDGGLNDRQPVETPAPEDLTADQLAELTPRK